MSINEKKLRNWTLPVAIICGLLFHKQLITIYSLTPYLLFGMMFFTCSKISVSEIRVRKIHIILLFVQVFLGIAIYLSIRRFNESLAQALMICVFTPVAIASPVIGGMLGADVTLMTTYVILSNVTAAIISPIFFSLITAGSDIPFLTSFIHIINKTMILLVLPLILSLFMHKYTPKVHAIVRKYQSASFYLWAVVMMLLIGSTFNSIFTKKEANHSIEIIMSIGALLLCLFQFYFGKKVGIHYGDLVAGRQMMGQKNTGIAIWLTISFLDPIASVAPASYIIWQNLLNSLEIWLESRRKK